MGNLEKRLEKLEQVVVDQEKHRPVRIIIRAIIAPGEVAEPHRYAILGDSIFQAAPEETEADFYKRIKETLPPIPGKVDLLFAYTERHWNEERPYERIRKAN